MSRCAQWALYPAVNPYTNRVIKIGGPTYRKLSRECNSQSDSQSRFKHPLVNPNAGRSIKEGGPAFRALKRRCKEFPPSPLEKFVKAQNTDDRYKTILKELMRGKKTGHWIWYIFPQIAGIASSQKSQYYAIGSLDEAKDYLDHPILGKRYLECVEILNSLRGRTITDIFDSDFVKVHSSLTLFHLAAPENRVINHALNKYFGGRLDDLTKFLV